MQSNFSSIDQASRFFARMAALHGAYLDQCRRAVEGRELSRAEAAVLLALAGGRTTASELCQALPLTKGMVSQVLTALRRKGLVTVTRSPGDRRVHPITPTPAGEAATRALDDAAAAFIVRVTRGVDPADMDRAESALETIFQNMKALGAPAPGAAKEVSV